MNKYIYVFRNELLLNLTYKGNIISSFIVQIIQMITTLFVWRAIYSQGTTIGDYNIEEMTAYLVLTSLLSVIFAPSSGFRLSSLVKTGKLSIYLTRPYSIFWENLSVFLGQKVVQAFVLIAIGLVFILFNTFQVTLPNIESVLLIMINFFLLFTFLSVIGELSFWLIEMWPLRPIYNGFLALFGGVMFPLDLLPAGFSNLIQYTPFSLFGYVNSKAMLGDLTDDLITKYLIASICWTVIFLLIYIILWKKGMKKYEGMGI